MPIITALKAIIKQLTYLVANLMSWHKKSHKKVTDSSQKNKSYDLF